MKRVLHHSKNSVWEMRFYTFSWIRSHAYCSFTFWQNGSLSKGKARKEQIWSSQYGLMQILSYVEESDTLKVIEMRFY